MSLTLNPTPRNLLWHRFENGFYRDSKRVESHAADLGECRQRQIWSLGSHLVSRSAPLDDAHAHRMIATTSNISQLLLEPLSPSALR